MHAVLVMSLFFVCYSAALSFTARV